MLLKNDQPYKLTLEDYQKMAEIIGCSAKKGKDDKPRFEEYPKGGVWIIPPAPYVTVNADGGKRLDRPALYIIPYEQSLDTNEGTVKWNYTQRPPTIKPGESPVYIGDMTKDYTHRFSVAENQPDLLFFLCCISRCGAHVRDANVISYRIENKKLEAINANSKRSRKIEVEAHILHPVTKLHPDDIARIAKAMRVENVEELTDDEVRHKLLEKIEAMEASEKRDGYKTFLEYTEVGGRSRVELLAGLQVLKDKKILRYTSTSNSWGIYDKEGKRAGKLCVLTVNKTADESLEYFATTNEDCKATVDRLIKEADQYPVPAA